MHDDSTYSFEYCFPLSILFWGISHFYAYYFLIFSFLEFIHLLANFFPIKHSFLFPSMVNFRLLSALSFLYITIFIIFFILFHFIIPNHLPFLFPLLLMMKVPYRLCSASCLIQVTIFLIPFLSSHLLSAIFTTCSTIYLLFLIYTTSAVFMFSLPPLQIQSFYSALRSISNCLLFSIATFPHLPLLSSFLLSPFTNLQIQYSIGSYSLASF